MVAVGVVQEQHPDRARLYRQWRQLKWPILVDSLNLLDLSVVPVPMAIDANGIVRHERIGQDKFVAEFLKQSYPRQEIAADFNRAERPDVDQLSAAAQQAPTAQKWRDLGDAAFLSGTSAESLTKAIDAYSQAVKLDATDARARFRWGVALRKRYETTLGTKTHEAADAQRAVDAWREALQLAPNRYIWRRRIQQYGPRLDKPYNFYFWVDQARREIRARGDKPVVLAVEPAGSELAEPVRGKSTAETKNPNPDPEGKISRDEESLIRLTSVVTPSRVRPGERVRIRVTMRPNNESKPHWNNESDRLIVSLKLPEGITLVEGDLVYTPIPGFAESEEERVLEAELAIGKLPAGPVKIPAYTLYNVCRETDGVCLYLRQDFALQLEIDPAAVKLR